MFWKKKMHVSSDVRPTFFYMFQWMSFCDTKTKTRVRSKGILDFYENCEAVLFLVWFGK